MEVEAHLLLIGTVTIAIQVEEWVVCQDGQIFGVRNSCASSLLCYCIAFYFPLIQNLTDIWLFKCSCCNGAATISFLAGSQGLMDIFYVLAVLCFHFLALLYGYCGCVGSYAAGWWWGLFCSSFPGWTRWAFLSEFICIMVFKTCCLVFYKCAIYLFCPWLTLCLILGLVGIVDYTNYDDMKYAVWSCNLISLIRNCFSAKEILLDSYICPSI